MRYPAWRTRRGSVGIEWSLISFSKVGSTPAPASKGFLGLELVLARPMSQTERVPDPSEETAAIPPVESPPTDAPKPEVPATDPAES